MSKFNPKTPQEEREAQDEFWHGHVTPGAKPSWAKFAIGDQIRTDKSWIGEVRGIVTTRSGEVRYVVEHEESGYLSIYPGESLKIR